MSQRTPQEDELHHLVERAKAGDSAAFRELLERFEGQALALSRQLGLGPDDAQDAVQEAFLKLFRYIRRFRSGESFKNWFYRIVVNTSYDQMRRTARGRTVPLDGEAGSLADGLSDPGVDVPEQADASRLRERVRNALQCLSAKERAVYVLRDLQGLETVEVARALRITQVTVRRHLSNARRKLRERLEGEYPELFRT